MPTYRLLTPQEIPAAVDLWVSVFGVEHEFFQTLLEGGAEDDFSVGAFEDGKQVSSVHVFMRWFRDQEGNPHKVGGIGSVSTLPEARAKGHSFHLLQMAITEMEDRDCMWSYLGTGVNDHYARHGWRTLSTPYFRGVLNPYLPGDPMQHEEVDEELLTRLAAIHQNYTSFRPMANVRSKAHWMHAAKYRTTRPEHRLYTAHDGRRTTAYLLCGIKDAHLDIIEGACAEGATQNLADLLRKRLALASTEGVQTVHYHLPEESGVFPTFEHACTQVWPAEDRAWMARPIAERISWPTLSALHSDPRGRRSELDHF